MNFKEYLRTELDEAAGIGRFLTRSIKRAIDAGDLNMPIGGSFSPTQVLVNSTLSRLQVMGRPRWWKGIGSGADNMIWTGGLKKLVRGLSNLVSGLPANHPLAEMINQLIDWIPGGGVNNLLELLQQGPFGQFFTTSVPGNLFTYTYDTSTGIIQFGLNTEITGAQTLQGYILNNNISAADQVTINAMDLIFNFLNGLNITA